MIELDKTFEPFTRAVNECYESVFPDLCRYPRFSFSRAMTILWKEKVYAKIKLNLLDAFTQILQEKKSYEIKAGKLMTKKESSHSLQTATNALLLPNLKKHDPVLANEIFKNTNVELSSRFIQSIADLSINELTIHYLGSTKLVLDEPYKELDELIQKQTK